jgi:hypothetical protein
MSSGRLPGVSLHRLCDASAVQGQTAMKFESPPVIASAWVGATNLGIYQIACYFLYKNIGINYF